MPATSRPGMSSLIKTSPTLGEEIPQPQAPRNDTKNYSSIQRSLSRSHDGYVPPPEKERDLALRALRCVGPVDQIATGHQPQITADRARRGLDRIRLAHCRAGHCHRVWPLEHHKHHWARRDVVDEARVERLALVLGIVTSSVSRSIVRMSSPTIFNPRCSSRPMISPVKPRCTASGLRITNVRSTATSCIPPYFLFTPHRRIKAKRDPNPEYAFEFTPNPPLSILLSNARFTPFVATIHWRPRLASRNGRRTPLLRSIAHLLERPHRHRHRDDQRNHDHRRRQQPLPRLHANPFRANRHPPGRAYLARLPFVLAVPSNLSRSGVASLRPESQAPDRR